MLKFIKNLFAKEEIPEEKIELNELNSWLEEKTKPIFQDLNNYINQIINKIDNEKEKVLENIKKLREAKLQNPNIPERAKTIMEGNRAAFIRKTSFFFANVDLKFNDYNELIKKCNNVENEIESLGKATARSYQVLNEFFAREAENIAINIKNIENYAKDIKNSIENNKISIINKIKNNVIEIQNKIRLKEKYSIELVNNKNKLQTNKDRLLEAENEINEIKSGEGYKNFGDLLKEGEAINKEINEIENKLFHDFSVLERALRKYSKIAFENENLIRHYLGNSINALIKDNQLEIIKVLNNLEKSLVDNKIGLDAKKSEKTLSKIKELNKEYFANIQNNYNKLKEKLNEIKTLIENNKSNNELKIKNKELESIKLNIENLNNNILSLNNELKKIDIGKLKESLQEEINNVVRAKVVIH